MFHDPKGGGFVQRCGNINHVVKIALFFFEELSPFRPGTDQTNWECGNYDQERVKQNCKFNDLQGRGSCAGAWHYREHLFSSSLPTLGHGLNKLCI